MVHRRHWRDYRTGTGRRPVREFLSTLTLDNRAKIAAAMRRVAVVGFAVARHLRGDLWEVRAEGISQSFRILFAPEGRFGQVLLALEAFSKKTQKTPLAKLELAEARLREWRARRARRP
jgi:phage-related protein